MRIGDATLFCGSCYDIAPCIEKFDAIIADPPYGYAYAHGGGDKRPWGITERQKPMHGDFGTMSFDPRPIFNLCPDKPQIWWGAHCYADKLPLSRAWLVWNKGIGDGVSLGQSELAWTNLDMSIKTKNHLWNGYAKGSEVGTPRVHPTQKPIAIMAWCLSLIPMADIIFDPFMGSGTTGVATLKLGRKFIGIEKDPHYFEVACRRIEEAWDSRSLLRLEKNPNQEQLAL